MEPAGARLCVQTALESRKIWALQVVRTVQLVGELAFGGAARRAQNGLAELPDAMSDCLRQFGCLTVASTLFPTHICNCSTGLAANIHLEHTLRSSRKADVAAE